MRDSDQQAAAFRALHSGPGFVLPNAWDPGSARILAQAGFAAIATTSAGIAWSLGIPDGQRLDRHTMLSQVKRIVDAVSIPVTADLESGYGPTSADVAETVGLAVDIGVVGGNIEDAVCGALLSVDRAAERIAAARSAAPRETFVLNARTDAYLCGADDAFTEAVERASRYLAAGADCVFVPGVDDVDAIGRLAASIPGPLNTVAGLSNIIDAGTLFTLGVRRVSVGGSLARASLSMLARAARELHDHGTLDFLSGAMSYAELQQHFSESTKPDTRTC